MSTEDDADTPPDMMADATITDSVVLVPPEREQHERESKSGRSASHHHETEDEKDVTLELLGPAYARNAQYWRILLFSGALQGIILGAAALAFFNWYTFLSQSTWKRGSYQDALDYNGNPSQDSAILNVLKLGNGPWWYVGMTAGGGFAVGVLKVIWSGIFPDHIFPERLPSFLMELRALQAEDVWLGFPALVTGGISIGLGASVGPEAVLGLSGSCVGTMFARRWTIGPFQAKKLGDTESGGFLSNILPDFSEDCTLCVMDGMAAAFAGIFPSQFISPLLIHELGGSRGMYAVTLTVARTGVAATFGYAMFSGFQNRTLLNQVVLPGTGYEVDPIVPPRDLVYAAVLGIISGVLGFLYFINLAIWTVIAKKISEKLDDVGESMGVGRDIVGKLCTPVIGGILIGLLCVAAPLIVSDGSDQLQTIISHSNILGLNTIIVTCLLKVIAGGISLGFCFVGGPVFPLIFAGTCLGVAATLVVPDLDPIIAIPTCFVAVPCAFIPGIFFMTLVSSMSFVLGGPATAPVFIGCIASYSTVCGMGLTQNLIMKAKKKEEAAAAAASLQGQDHP